MTRLTLAVSVKMKVDLDVTFDPTKRERPPANRSRENRAGSLTFDPEYLGTGQGHSQGHVRVVGVTRSTSM
jgi:hypothetical protein